MSYEKTGLGWSEPYTSWWSAILFGPLADSHAGKCNIGGYGELTREVCFEPGEESIAQGSGCVQRFTTLTGNEIGCVTEANNEGKLWCCRPSYPRPYFEPTTPATTPDGTPSIPELPPIPEEFKAPTARPASFFTKLLQPGPMIAIGLFSLAGVLVYHNWKAEQ